MNRNGWLAAQWADPDTFGTVLWLAALDRFGLDAFGIDVADDEKTWDPQTIESEIEQALGGRVPSAQFDKMMAVWALRRSDKFFTSLPDFADLANALCGDGYDPHRCEPPDVDECAWAVTEARLWCSEMEYAPDIVKYIQTAARYEGLLALPATLQRLCPDAGDWTAELRARLDEPALSSAMEEQRQRKADLDRRISNCVAALADQLDQLSLRSADVKPLVAKLRQIVQPKTS